MNRRASWITLIGTFCQLLGGCGRQQAITPSDRNLLLLHERLPLGSTPAEVRRLFPAVGQQKPEGGDWSLTDVTTQVEVMGTRVTLEFNFARDSLYAVSFLRTSLSATAGDRLFERLITFYSARLGQAHVSDGQDAPYFVKMRFWPAPGCEVDVVNSIQGDMRQLGWGYQVPINLRTSVRE